MAKFAQREVVDLQVKSRTSLGINAKDFACNSRGFTVQQARAQFCDHSGWDFAMFFDKFISRNFHQMLNQRLSSVGAVLSIVCFLFPLDVDPPLGAATAVTPMWTAPLVRLTVRVCRCSCKRLGYGGCNTYCS